jgi:ferritin-like metal-binding protein YciE
MAGDKGHELLMHGLKDMYDAEHKFAEALTTMAEKAKDRALADGFRRHREITRGQIRRLEECFEQMGQRPQREECAGAAGLVEEYETFVRKEQPDRDELDVFAANAGLKVEHYEIAAYAGMIDLALRLDMQGCAELLEKNLREEEATAAELEMSSRKLGAELTGSSGGLRGAIAGLRAGSRSGGLGAMGRAVRNQASGAVSRLEARGRRASRSKSSSSRPKSTSGRKRATTRGRKSTTRRSTTSSARNGRRTTSRARTTGSRRTSTGRSAARSSSRPRSRSTSSRRTSRSTGTRRGGRARSRGRR